MKKFKFKYENVLVMREKKVDDFKHQLSEFNSRLKAEEQQLLHLEDDRRRFFFFLDEKMSQGCRADEIQSFNSSKAYFDQSIKLSKQNITSLNLEIDNTKNFLMDAMKELKIMEKLKEKDYKNFLERIEVEEKKVIEEIVNYNNYKMRGD